MSGRRAWPPTSGEHGSLEHGVGSTWVSRFRAPEVARLLDLPHDVVPCEILVCGYPLGEGQMAPKKPLSEVVFRERWGM
ncbi:MAG: nitroreductase family protein [Anaerolineae bacterium]